MLVLLSTKCGETAIEDLMPLAFRIIRFKMLAHRRKARRRGEYTSTDLEGPDAQVIASDEPTPEDQARHGAKEWSGLIPLQPDLVFRG